jgi:hypothetical protein
MSKLWKLLAIAVAGFSIAVYFWVEGQHRTALTGVGLQPSVQLPALESPVAAATQSTATSTLSSLQNAASLSGTRSPHIGISSHRSSIVDAFEKSNSWTSFIESAKRSPAEGGYFMASIAANNCAMYVKKTLAQIDPTAVAAQNPSLDRRTAALQLIQSRCDGFEASKDNDVASLLKEGARQGDPIIKLQNDLRIARMDGQLGAEQVRQAFAVGNPYAIEAAMSAFQASDDSRLLYKDNAVSGDDSRYLRLAFQLLPCAFGLDCGPTSTIAMHDCVTLGGSCDTDRFQQIQGWGVAPREWERVMQYYNEIEYAYRNGNYSVVAVKPRNTNIVKK